MTRSAAVFCLFVFAIAGAAWAQPETNNIHKFMARGLAKPAGGGSIALLQDHGGPVIVAPKVAMIFWGFGSKGTSYTSAMQSFRSTGIYPYIQMLPQYRNAGASAATNMGGATNDKFDSSTPPQAVTDADVQAEVVKYFGGKEDASTIYEVFIPATSYSQSGNSTSCGGPVLQYCAYHGHFADGSNDVKYSIQPYPSCSGCQSSGFSDAQNQDHFVIHESREAITDEDLNAWYDRRGFEADDKCAWSPTPFIDQSTGFAYQYEWSNAASGCVQK